MAIGCCLGDGIIGTARTGGAIAGAAGALVVFAGTVAGGVGGAIRDSSWAFVPAFHRAKLLQERSMRPTLAIPCVIYW
ncbi:MAG: hypothetical protein AAGC68_08100, partial [Verrucomicrobiota bacterium]